MKLHLPLILSSTLSESRCSAPAKGLKCKTRNYYHKLSAALQQAVTDCVRAGVADNRITELRQIVTEQARLEQEFSEKLKGVYV